MDLTDKVALITGGGTGIGEATITLLVKENAKFYTCGRREEPLSKYLGSYSVGDVTKKSDVKKIVAGALRQHGRIDILVNNAGTFEHNHRLTDTTEEQWEYVLKSNLKSVHLMSREVLPHMMRQGSGVIINVGSVIATTGAPNAAAYIAAKGGVIALTKSMAVDYAQYDIRVNCVSPSFIETDMTRNLPDDVKERILQEHLIKRMGKPEDVAQAIVYLAKANWVTGVNLPVDGGASLR